MEKEEKKYYWTEIYVKVRGYGKIYYRHKECQYRPCDLFENPYPYCPYCGHSMKEKQHE